jgi:hypothetical protein
MKITFGHVTFDAELAAGKTQKEFIQHELHTGLTPEQLKEAHMLCKVAIKAPVETPADPAPETT